MRLRVLILPDVRDEDEDEVGEVVAGAAGIGREI